MADLIGPRGGGFNRTFVMLPLIFRVISRRAQYFFPRKGFTPELIVSRTKQGKNCNLKNKLVFDAL